MIEDVITGCRWSVGGRRRRIRIPFDSDPSLGGYITIDRRGRNFLDNNTPTLGVVGLSTPLMVMVLK